MIFNEINANEVICKKPLICFYSSIGACGPCGFILVVFSDRSFYCYSSLGDKKIIIDIVENIPELSPLLQIEDEYKERRKRYLDEMTFYYLGLGNTCFIHDSLLKGDDKVNIKSFKKLVEELMNKSMDEMYKEVMEEISGHK